MPNEAGLRRLAAIALMMTLPLVTIACSDEKDAKAISAELDAGLKAHVEGRFDDAADAYRQVLEDDPENKFAIYNLGLIDQTTGHPTAAESKYRLVLQIDPDYAPALFNLAILRAKVGDPDEAIVLYRRAIAVNPGDGPAHLNLSLLLREQGRIDEADAELAKAVELDASLVTGTDSTTTTPGSPPTTSD